MQEKEKLFSVAAVIVTYNRIEKLKVALESYEKQTLLPEYIIVVNNCSNDSTKSYLEKWQEESDKIKKIVINTTENLGGSGGFYVGQEEALKLDVEWIYIADDDAYPEERYFENINKFILNYTTDNIAVVCGKVKQNNNYENEHRAIITNAWKINFYRGLKNSDYNNDAIQIDLVSYVGILINKKALEKVGLVNKDYFIWQDDIEHSLRLKNYGKLFCLSDTSILHDADNNHYGLSWKTYYFYRNRVNLIKKHFGFKALILIFILAIKAILCPLKGKSLVEVKMRLIAIKNGLFNKLGKHPIYKPGWKP